jgi:hypothetical protein
MTATLKLDSKARGSLAKLGGRPGQTYTVHTDGPRIVLEPVEPKAKEGKTWKPTVTFDELYEGGAVPDWEPGRVKPEKVRRIML